MTQGAAERRRQQECNNVLCSPLGCRGQPLGPLPTYGYCPFLDVFWRGLLFTRGKRPAVCILRLFRKGRKRGLALACSPQSQQADGGLGEAHFPRSRHDGWPPQAPWAPGSSDGREPAPQLDTLFSQGPSCCTLGGRSPARAPRGGGSCRLLEVSPSSHSPLTVPLSGPGKEDSGCSGAPALCSLTPNLPGARGAAPSAG